MPVDTTLLGGAVLNPGAYGSVPNYPATTTDTATQTSTWTPNLPNYAALAAQASGLAGSEMQGVIPPDVIAAIEQAAAERGIATGSPGSANANAAYLRSLGLTSLALQQQGLSDYERLLAGAPRTTTGTTSQTTSNANLIAEAAAAPNPYLAALANLGAVNAGLNSGNTAGTGAASPMRITGPAGPIFASDRTATAMPSIPGPGGSGSPLGYGLPYSGGIGALGTSPAGYALPGAGAQGGFSLGTGQNGIIDAQGDEWVQLGNNWLNLTTGEQNQGMPGAGFDYTAPGGSSLAWSGQDWSSYFDLPTTPTSTPSWEQPNYEPSIDEYGDEWVTLDDGTQQNLTSGEYYDPWYDEYYYE